MNRCGRALRSLLWLLCASMIFFALAASAQDDDDEDFDDEDSAVYSAPMKYVSIGLIGAAESFDSNIGDKNDDKKGYLKNVRNTGDPIYGAQLRLGNRAMEYLAFELELDVLANIKFDGDKKNGTKKDVSAQGYVLTFNIKAFPFHDLTEKVLNGRFQPYLLFGGGGMAADGTSIDTPMGLAIRAGGGAEYYLSQNVAIHLESTYLHTWQQVEGMNMVQVVAGLSYHFD